MEEMHWLEMSNEEIRQICNDRLEEACVELSSVMASTGTIAVLSGATDQELDRYRSATFGTEGGAEARRILQARLSELAMQFLREWEGVMHRAYRFDEQEEG
jgi:hypothetical protein